jgi:hypothetical protein
MTIIPYDNNPPPKAKKIHKYGSKRTSKGTHNNKK